MQTDSAANVGSKLRLRSLEDLDRRTKVAQRAYAAKEALIAHLGGDGQVTPLQCQAVEEAIGTSAIIGHVTTQLLKGEPMELPSGQPVSLAEYVSLRNCARRDREAFGWEPSLKDVTPAREYLAHKAAEARKHSAVEAETE